MSNTPEPGLVEDRRGRFATWLMPGHKRKSLDELTDTLDLGIGDATAKRSAFWAMLFLSAVIATAGVVTDSTATVIGAMIIAPLATPIMGVALGIVVGDAPHLRRALRYLVLGLLLVVVIGVVGALCLPQSFDLLGDSQISGRTSPTLGDLAAAIATGFAGAIGLVRRDVSDVLPGVAVAISLVPPLAVVGVCLGQGAFSLATGAFVLFLSNVIAMVVAGTMLFALAYRAERREAAVARPARAYLTIGVLGLAVVVVLAANTVLAIAVSVFEQRIQVAADGWLAGTSGAEVLDVSFHSTTAVLTILTPTEPPSPASLKASLRGQVPSGMDLVIEVQRGQRIDAGTVD